MAAAATNMKSRQDEALSTSPRADRDAWDYDVAFSRHRGLIAADEQERLRRARVAVVGCGGVGGIHAATLARLGIGGFSVADLDRFELVNFNRQHGARMETLGRPKAEVTAHEIRQINPDADVRVFARGVDDECRDDFLDGADLFVDGIDFFAMSERRRLFRAAAERKIPAITAGPMGFGVSWISFDPEGTSFDEYFGLSDGQSNLEQLIAFAVGLSPALLQRPYVDLREVDLARGQGPSAALSCQLCAGVVAAEAVKILLKRGGVRFAPAYAQFDAYRGVLRRGRLWGASRHPLQRLKRWWLSRALAAKEAR